MKLLTDENIGLEVVQFLRQEGSDVISAIEEFPSAPDLSILQKAREGNRILITSDKDFGELIYQQQLAHKGVVLLRLRDETNKNKISVLSKLLEAYGKELKNKFVVVTEDRVRIRISLNTPRI